MVNDKKTLPPPVLRKRSLERTDGDGTKSKKSRHVRFSMKPEQIEYPEQPIDDGSSESSDAITSDLDPRSSSSDNVETIPKCSKILIGHKFIAVDRFAVSDGCKFHFLTHAHTDHMVNLSSSWRYPIYCSEETAAFLPILTRTRTRRGLNAKCLRPLKMGEVHTIEPNLQVTLIDANHCPGSVMFLFEGASVPGGAVMCTGDFRADQTFISRMDAGSDFGLERLKAAQLNRIYFDNTHISHEKESFISREESCKRLTSLILDNPDTSFILPFYKLGREDVLEKMSASVEECVALYDVRYSVYEKRRNLGVDMCGHFVQGSDEATRIRTVQRSNAAISKAVKSLESACLVVDLSVRDDLTSSVDRNVLIRIEYSDHSSKEEIEQFFARLSLRRCMLYPTSTSLSDETAQRLLGLCNSVETDSCPSQSSQGSSIISLSDDDTAVQNIAPETRSETTENPTTVTVTREPQCSQDDVVIIEPTADDRTRKGVANSLPAVRAKCKNKMHSAGNVRFCTCSLVATLQPIFILNGVDCSKMAPEPIVQKISREEPVIAVRIATQ